jgi:hypothetical protein
LHHLILNNFLLFVLCLQLLLKCHLTYFYLLILLYFTNELIKLWMNLDHIFGFFEFIFILRYYIWLYRWKSSLVASARSVRGTFYFIWGKFAKILMYNWRSWFNSLFSSLLLWLRLGRRYLLTILVSLLFTIKFANFI